jgi:hypothetical protein
MTLQSLTLPGHIDPAPNATIPMRLTIPGKIKIKRVCSGVWTPRFRFAMNMFILSPNHPA